MTAITAIDEAVIALTRGEIIAYPTEGVYGLGCDPFNEHAIKTLLALKNRSVEKGLILIAANWLDVAFLIDPLPPGRLEAILSSWPDAVTWLFPASKHAPRWICGNHATIALRITAHPIARALCQAWGKPLVSTSVNRFGEKPLCDADDVMNTFGGQLGALLTGAVGELKGPTPIRDALTGEYFRR